MKAGLRLALAALPGAVVALAALAGRVPTARDLPAYFVPLRHCTAEALAGTRSPFWNTDAGCGEPFFANPQSALLYPPAWLAVLLPADVAVGAEVGFHMLALAVGCALLARRLGASAWLELAAGWAAVTAGPVLDAAGVLNNLESLAWAPWVWWAALGGGGAATAGFLALAYLAAEPQLAALAGFVALALAPTRRTLAAVLLAASVVAVQAVPFAAWVRGGDRGNPGSDAAAVAGSVAPRELFAIAVPGAVPEDRAENRFVDHLGVALWALVLAAVAVADRRRPVRRLAWCGWALLAWSVVPSLPGGAAAWNAVTGGWVRYPGRLLFPAVVALVPAAAAAAGARRPRAWAGIALAVVACAAGLLLGGSRAPVVVGAAAAGAALAAPFAAPAALVGALVGAWDAPGILAMRARERSARTLCLEAQREAARVFPVAPSRQQLAWVGGDPGTRARSLCLGYAAALDGRRSARTFAPVSSRALEAHLTQADRGPAGRWWLDALGADRIVSQHPVPGFPEVCRDGDLVVDENPRAWPIASLACRIPGPGEPLEPCGRVRPVVSEQGRRSWSVEADAAGGVFLWLRTPDPGWDVRVDGRPAPERQGAGILHGVDVPGGAHEVTERYRPPGLVAGAIVSVLGAALLVGSACRRW